MKKTLPAAFRIGLALFMVGAALSEFARAPAVVESVRALGYPEFVLTILAPAKLAASVALLTRRFARWRALAAFGLVVNLVGAVASMGFAGVAPWPDVLVAPAALALAVVVFAYEWRHCHLARRPGRES